MFKKFFNRIIDDLTNTVNQYPDCAETREIKKNINHMKIEYGKLQWTKNGLRKDFASLGSNILKLCSSFVKYVITLIPIAVIIAGIIFVVVKVIF